MSAKKGFVVGKSDTVGGAKVNELNAKWYYTWGQKPSVPPPSSDIPFTPMIWNINKTPSVDNVISSFETLNITNEENILLTYNEPDGINQQAQGDMTVEQAVQYWPKIVTNGRRIGAPVMYGSLINVPSDAPGTGKNINNMPQPSNITLTNGTIQINISNNDTPNIVTLNPEIWLDNFLIQVSQITPKSKFPDFITIHWYGPPDANSFLNYLQNVYNKYNLPIWVTEYSVADWNATFNTTTNNTQHSGSLDWSYPTEENIETNATAQFMRDTINGMNAMAFVERYSWKERFLLSPPGTTPTSNNSVEGPTNPDVMGQSALFQSYEHFPETLPSLTPLGKLYASL